jgi:hypothetical protein
MLPSQLFNPRTAARRSKLAFTKDQSKQPVSTISRRRFGLLSTIVSATTVTGHGFFRHIFTN